VQDAHFTGSSALVRHWAEIISSTGLSRWLQDQLWVIPTSQSIHIVCVSVVFASSLLISIRLLTANLGKRTVSQLASTLVPWMYRALIVLALTGAVQTYAEPMRQFVAPAFWSKMAMILCALSLTIWFSKTVQAKAASWDRPETRPPGARIFAVVSIGLWIAIIFCGRFIGYTYQFYL
jgi:hypothetical protein